ncbi:MAG: carboxypeptidase-like regulatory domain-containing protein [Cyclobacteriaceae bacterium]|nr:carboxypeptidase-like regulatory domain-containing protein [Cyclobacteriaceae bacterium HetDA_MAG_MS6]
MTISQVKYITAFFVVLWNIGQVIGQTTTVSGKVIETETGSPVPFANVVFTGTSDGAITDFDGNFIAKTTKPVDSIEVRYIGFLKKIKPVLRGESQTINFQLEEDVQTLAEVVVYAGENPAFPILRNIKAAKDANDKRALNAYEYESYTKIELDIDNISEKFRNRKLVKKITSVLDSIDQIAGEDGKPILPVFISEAISKFYFRNSPTFRHEHVLKTKIRGVGITDGSTTSQIIGSTLQEYNFYQNWLSIVGKEFVSPIADSWKLYYEYDLDDSLYIGNDYCYQISFFPKNEQDLAFRGTFWVTKEEYALKRIDATVGKSANLNFIEKIKIQQDLIKTDAGPWLPEKSRVLVDISQITGETAGLLAKFYTSTKDYVINQPKESGFYQNPVTMDWDAQEDSEEYWQEHRHDSLTATEENVYQMIDTLRKIPVIRFYSEALKTAVTGYITAGPIDLGPYNTLYGNNDVEGLRLGLAARTNFAFSKKYTLGGFVGYGFGDDRWKYLGYANFILDRDPWTTIRIERQREIEQIWLLNENVGLNSFFYTFSRFGNLEQPFLIEKNRISIQRQMGAGLNQTLEFKQESFDPQFDFTYRENLDDPSQVASRFDITEVTLSTRYARDEIFVVNDNERLSLGTVKWPAITLSYTYGMDGVLGSDLSYHKVKLRFQKKQKMGLFGISNFDLVSGYIFGEVPYPLLFNPIGNETPIYVGFAYNLMQYFEFSSDQYVELRYKHSFEGFLLNKVPLLRKLKWRLVGNANLIYGGMRDANKELIVTSQNNQGEEALPFFTFGDKPYVELGYGIENIFKIFRVDAFHRLTYLDHPNVNKFGLKFSVQVIL